MNALILVDLQNDFMPGGALAVARGNEVVKVANQLMPNFDFVVATQDWHPADHGSFASQHENQKIGDVIQLGEVDQVLWPDHCVQGSHGADFHRDLRTELINHVVRKGTDRQIDSYSGFFDNQRDRSTGLERWLKERAVNEVAVMGLATDYCVKFTALDALNLGFLTFLILDGCRGVNLKSGDSMQASKDMGKAGIEICLADHWIETYSWKAKGRR